MTESGPQSLESYLQRRFDPVLEGEVPPVPDEAHVGWWRGHHQARGGSASSLVEALAQFQIPIAEHASTSEAYARAIRGGQAIMDPQAAEGYYVQALALEPDNAVVRANLANAAVGGIPIRAKDGSETGRLQQTNFEKANLVAAKVSGLRFNECRMQDAVLDS